jgi:hypothetical protein
MKLLLGLILGLFLSRASDAAPKIDGVPYNCLNAVRYQLIREFAAQNPDHADEVSQYRDYIRATPAYACRSRQNPRVEHFNWCDGSGCTGATGTLRNGRCTVSGSWTGLDKTTAIALMPKKL